MESLGVVSRMVAVQKANGAVCICIDLKPLKNILREVHPLPKVETTLA